MRRVSAPRAAKIGRLSTEQRSQLRTFLIDEHEKIIGGRAGWERTVRNNLRMYQGTIAEKRWVPFENAPQIEITVCALAVDAIYAQALDLIFQAVPAVTVRSRKKDYDDAADAVQDYIDWGINSRGFNFKRAIKTAVLDDVQIGTMVAYIPWSKTVRKTATYAEIIREGPFIHCLDPKDFLVSLSADDIQAATVCSMRLWMEQGEFNLNARMQNWVVDDGVSSTEATDNIGRDRLKLAGLDDGLRTGSQGKLYEILDTFCYYDIDGDGVPEDLEIIWNRTTGGLLKVMYNRWDSRPFALNVYQERAHVIYGISPMEMGAPYEEEITDIHNNRIWNMMISNTKMYNVPATMADEAKTIYPGKMWEMMGDETITPIDMGEMSNAPIQSEMATLALLERRIGVNELAAQGRIGGRTPGITALTQAQQANRRFFPPFDNIRDFISDIFMQCLLRLQERIRLPEDDDTHRAVVGDLEQILGEEKASLFINLLRKSELELSDALDIEVTASSVSVNRESDRQNMMLVLQAYEKYLAGMASLAQTKAQPPFKGADKIADKAATAINKFMFNFLRTFDQITEVKGYLVTLEDVQAMGQSGIDGLAGQMQGALGIMQGDQQGQPQNGAPPVIQ